MIRKLVAGGAVATALTIFPAAPAGASASTFTLTTAVRPISQLPVELRLGQRLRLPVTAVTADVIAFGNETFALTLTPDETESTLPFLATASPPPGRRIPVRTASTRSGSLPRQGRPSPSPRLTSPVPPISRRT
jgi:hypothetical protein